MITCYPKFAFLKLLLNMEIGGNSIQFKVNSQKSVLRGSLHNSVHELTLTRPEHVGFVCFFVCFAET